MKEKKRRDFNHIKCIKNDDQKVLVKNNDIKERWIEYFNELFNEDSIGGLKTRENTSLARHTFYRRNRVAKVKKALVKGKLEKLPDKMKFQ